MNFAQRNGFEPEKEVQLDFIDDVLRTRLFNLFDKIAKELPLGILWSAMEYVGDKLGFITLDRNTTQIYVKKRFLNQLEESKWYDPYSIIELFVSSLRIQAGCHNCTLECSSQYCNNADSISYFQPLFNLILEEEKSGYRMIDWIFVPITGKSELQSIEESISVDYSAAGIHIKKAMGLYSDRANPDYENSIKESISAVESMCCYITGLQGKQATLGKAIKKLEDNGVVIHESMKSAFNQLYSYTSDSSGIRHGGIDFKNAPAEDAKYMLISCSAFVNYLAEKYSKIGGGT